MITHIPLLVIATFLQLMDSGGQPTPATFPTEPLEQPWLLLAAVAMCALSVFLLHEAARFHVWVTAKDKAAPSSLFGLGFAYAFSLLMVILASLYLIVRYPPAVEDRTDLGAVLTWYFLHHPSELAAGVLLASIVPSAIAIFTFAMAGFIMRDAGQELPPLSRSPRAALVGVIFSSISLTGSIAGLIRFVFWMKEP